MYAVKICRIAISFWLMVGSMNVQGQQALNLEERVRTVSRYYAARYARLYSVPLELVGASSKWSQVGAQRHCRPREQLD